ncbi:MAG: hypothetical protein WBG92_05165 [Thiohalocapsa sp.]
MSRGRGGAAKAAAKPDPVAPRGRESRATGIGIRHAGDLSTAELTARVLSYYPHLDPGTRSRVSRELARKIERETQRGIHRVAAPGIDVTGGNSAPPPEAE